jgi:hypothetical protein
MALWGISLCVVVIGVAAAPVASAQQQLNAEQMELINKTAHEICETVTETKGRSTETQIQGNVQAELAGLAGKLLDFGRAAKGSRATKNFEGLTKEATAIALRGDRDCRERLSNNMFDALHGGTSSNTQPQLSIDLMYWGHQVPLIVYISNLSNTPVDTVDVEIDTVVPKTTARFEWGIDPLCHLENSIYDSPDGRNEYKYTVLATCKSIRSGESRRFDVDADEYKLDRMRVYVGYANTHLDTYFVAKTCCIPHKRTFEDPFGPICHTYYADPSEPDSRIFPIGCKPT